MTSPFNWHHAVTLTFDLFQDKTCCRVGTTILQICFLELIVASSTVSLKHLALPIEDRERNLSKSILARVCTLNVCGYSTLLRSVQWKVHKNTLLKQDIFVLWGGTNLHECLEWTEICPYVHVKNIYKKSINVFYWKLITNIITWSTSACHTYLCRKNLLLLCS